MSLHKSLGRKGQDLHRNVLKRFERIKILKEKNKWDEKNPKYFGLPKVKSLKVKVKKAKVEKPTEAAVSPEISKPAPEGKGEGKK